MVLPGYFRVQQINFALLGLNPLADNPNDVVQNPLLCYGLILINFFNFILTGHFIMAHNDDYTEVADALPMFCQTILTMVKIFIFLRRRLEIMNLISFLRKLNVSAKGAELYIIRQNNLREIFIGTIYFRTVIVTAIFSLLHPVLYAAYVYWTTGKLVLEDPNKATYFWPHSSLAGYSLVFILNVGVMHFVCSVSLAIDTLFSWLICNILAQFHILCHRFHQLNSNESKVSSKATNCKAKKIFKGISLCVQHHCKTLDLAAKLNKVYGEIILIKFVIICTEICCLVFFIMLSHESLGNVAYKCLYLAAVTIQLSVYCYNGQRIKDESALVSTEIYNAFDWSRLDKSNQKLLLISMMRSTRSCNLSGVFFEVNMALYLWVFKTAGSLVTALKTLEEK